VTSWAEIVAQEERNAPHNSITMEVPERRTVQHTEIEGEVRNDNAANMELEKDNGQEMEERTMDREQEGPATKKVHRDQQERTDSTQPKQKRDRTEQIEERTSSNDGS